MIYVIEIGLALAVFVVGVFIMRALGRFLARDYPPWR